MLHPALSSVFRLAILACVLALGAGCDAPREAPSESSRGTSPEGPAKSTSQALVGQDGALTVNAVDTVVNQYAVLGANAAVGATSVNVTNIADLNSATLGPLGAGDLVLLIQMQGATINTSDTLQYGTITALNNAGRYELVGVTGTAGNTINLDNSCGGLKYAYTTAGNVQVVRVPQFTTLTVAAGGSITAPAWDGARGGVAVVHAQTTVTLNGAIDVSGKGFRGGAIDNQSDSEATGVTVYRSIDPLNGGEKGESIAGFQAAYTNGRYGRGAPANAGGGGNSHNAGGGGGANAKNVVTAWSGQGVMSAAVVGGAAWMLDPGYVTNGNAFTASPGGGRGGYTYSANDQNALLTAPGNAAWAGNNRREGGGLGGRPLDVDALGRIFFGGGGGAGDGNNNGAGAGGRGGGIAIVFAATVNGASAIRANGANGGVTTAAHNDAPGGGGGGGTILVNATTVTAIAVEAKGGNGGNQLIVTNEAEGPGGGGGGGFVVVAPAALPTVTVAGGTGGTTTSAAVTEFPSNGATNGNSGLTASAGATFSACIDATSPETTIATFEPNPTNDPTGDFTFTSNDATATFECSIDGGAFAACPATFSTAALAQGSHTIQVRAKDPAGNVDATPASYTWVVDTTAPDTTIVVFEPNPTSDPTGDFTFSSNDATATFECRVDGAAFAPCTAVFSTAALADGSHTIQVRAKDPAGNVDATPASYTWVVDTTTPDTTIAIFEPNPTNDPTGDFTFAASIPNSTFECSVDGAAFAACPASFSTAALADGSHTILVRAKSPNGTVDPTPASYTWVVDTTAPDTSFLTTEPNPTNDPTGDFTFGSNDPTATFECSLDGAAFEGCSAVFATDPLADGSHTLLVRAKDPAGNVDATPASYTWVVDTMAPDTSFVTTEPSPTGDPTGDFTFGSNDPTATFECSLDGAAFAPCPQTFSTPALAPGSHTIQVRAKDPAGNVDPSPASYTWTVVDDSDGDGLTDVQEDAIGTDPNDADSDDDGVLDGAEPSFAADTDGDGKINALDPDSDDDGLFDGTELGLGCSSPATDTTKMQCIADADMGATTTDPLDADSDDGTVEDGAEDTNKNGQVDPGERDPSFAGDDVDSDGDGIGDPIEVQLGSDPNDADSDDDGVPDGQEPSLSEDSDGDGLINILDPDSDDDGLFDGTELGLGCANPATDVGAGHCTPDADMGATVTDPVDADSDDGGVEDGGEDTNLNGQIDPGESDPTAGHGADDAMNTDTDGDGLSDGLEETIGTDPLDADSDDDGVIDGQEPNPALDSDGDGLINALDPDSDNDGLFDGTELGLDCSNPATDPAAGNCVADGDGGATITSPLLKDTDGGGVSDGSEDINRNGVLDPGEIDPTLGHGADDATEPDTDGDGLSDELEDVIGTDPNDTDSDDDGVIDGLEPNPTADTDGDGIINALDPDSDEDGLFDGTELGFDCSNPGTDPAAGTCIADADPSTRTSPLIFDTDGGTVGDGDEDKNHDGKLDPDETDPTVGHGDDDLLVGDDDGDGLSNGFELSIGTDPNDADSDDDGVTDGDEPDLTEDTDGDGKINALDPDSDDDGLFDGTELGLGCDDPATDASQMQCIPDGDLGATTTDPLDPDTDGGTVKDGDEDENHNGVVDGDETDPNDAKDDVATGCMADGECGSSISGMVCNLDTSTCEDGCHTPGNGCPKDLVCTSDDATIGACVECTDDAQCGDETSGMACDLDKNTCVEGCTEEGNGCPDGQVCDLTAAQSIGVCRDAEVPDDVIIAEGSGLLCAASPRSGNGDPAGWLVPLALGGLLAARRRRR